MPYIKIIGKGNYREQEARMVYLTGDAASALKEWLDFRNSLEIDACASSKKPLSKNYKKIMKVYNVTQDKVACVGDQLLTDILGANKLNMVSILVNPMSKGDSKFTIFNRFIEKILFKIMDKQDIFKKGEYYE